MAASEKLPPLEEEGDSRMRKFRESSNWNVVSAHVHIPVPERGSAGTSGKKMAYQGLSVSRMLGMLCALLFYSSVQFG